MDPKLASFNNNLMLKSPQSLKILKRFRDRAKRTEKLRVKVLKHNFRRRIKQEQALFYLNYSLPSSKPRQVTSQINIPSDKKSRFLQPELRRSAGTTSLDESNQNEDEIEEMVENSEVIEEIEEFSEVELGTEAMTLITLGTEEMKPVTLGTEAMTLITEDIKFSMSNYRSVLSIFVRKFESMIFRW